MKKSAVSVCALFGLTWVLTVPAADFNGDGTGDIAIFRSGSGLWSVRGITRLYFGSTGDTVVPGDYDGSGTDSPTIFRAASGLWAVRGVTRIYFGSGSDEAEPGDYNGDGTFDIGIFRENSGLWAIRGLTRIYYGTSGDEAISPGKVTRRGGVAFTGQTKSWMDGDDGYYQMGGPFRYETRAFPPWVPPGEEQDWVVIDHRTGLMWARDGDEEGCHWGQQTGWFKAITYCNDLDFAGYDDWRLPNIKELQSIVDYGADNPAIDTSYFTNTKSEWYWSSTSHKIYSYFAWQISFQDGDVGTRDKTDGIRYIRAVRGGQ